MADDLALVALSAGEMPQTQQALSAWCDTKRAALEEERKDLEEHLLIAQANGWKLRGLQASISRTIKRLVYYDKVKAAVDAGFLIVPNFPVRLLAVRVDRDKEKQKESSSYYATFSATPALLPTGDGRYVDEQLAVEDRSYLGPPDAKGAMQTVTRKVSGAYDEPDFPFVMVKPAVLDATQRAMALKVFDTIGIVATVSAHKDPIMVGQILDPRGNGRHATFFIAWWLNTRDL